MIEVDADAASLFRLKSQRPTFDAAICLCGSLDIG
jgi:hypothetical protein